MKHKNFYFIIIGVSIMTIQLKSFGQGAGWTTSPGGGTCITTTPDWIGIGVAAPAAVLDIDGNLTPGCGATGQVFQTNGLRTLNNQWRLWTQTPPAAAAERFQVNVPANSNNVELSVMTATGNMNFRTNGGQHMTILGNGTPATNGFVGIGNNAAGTAMTPGFSLDVFHDINLQNTGTITSTGATNAFLAVYRLNDEPFLYAYNNNNTFIGLRAGTTNPTSFSNLVFGSNGTNHNVFVGNDAGSHIGAGSHNQFIGSNAGNTNTTGSGNCFIGSNSGYANTSGIYNIFIGQTAGNTNVTGSNNIFIGHDAGLVSTGNANIFMGSSSGSSNTGANNTFIGTSSGLNNTSSGDNTFIGNQSGQYNVSSFGANTYVGSFSGWGSTSSQTSNTYSNTFIGASAGRNMLTGNYNTFVGTSAGNYLQDGDKNVLVGRYIGSTSAHIRNYNTFVGTEIQAGSGTNILGENTVVGFQAAYYNQSDSLTAMGTYSAYSNTTGKDNSFFGYKSGYSNNVGGDNTFLGFRTGYSNTTADSNTFAGSYSGFTNTVGNRNTFYGAFAGFTNNTARNNSFFGFRAGYFNTTDSNTFAGSYCGFTNSSGTHNTFIGTTAGYFNATGRDNTFLGFRSGWTNTADSSTFVGSFSGFNNTSGTRNSFFGLRAGVNNSTGSDNSSLGINSGPSTGALSNSTSIGANSAVSQNNSMVLGNGSTSLSYHVGIGINSPIGNFHVADMNSNPTDGSDDIRFEDLPPNDTLDVLVYSRDNSLGQGRVYYANKHLFAMNDCFNDGFVPYYDAGTGRYKCSIIEQQNVSDCSGSHDAIGIGGAPLGSYTSSGTCFDLIATVNGNGLTTGAWFVLSDEKIKKNISKISSSLDKVKSLRGVTYEYDVNNSYGLKLSDGIHYGFIAQEVEKVLPEIILSTNKNIKAINYEGIIPVLTEAIKEQQKQLDAKDEKIAQLESRLDDFENSLSECCMNYQQGNDNSKTLSNSSNEMAKLEQNNPNPFTDITSVKYFIPSQSGKAILKIYSLAGVELKSYIISEKGMGQITISGNTFSAGTYVYNLIVDDKQVDSKYMTLTK